MTSEAGLDPMGEPEGLVELMAGPIAAGGGCVARHPDGRVVFVRHTLPGERVRARITSVSRRYLRADAIEIVEASPDRVAPPCPHAGPGRCGGCDFQHIELGAQRRLKGQWLREQLGHLAGVDVEPVVEAVPGDADGLGWRTRLRLALDGEGRPGFRKHRSHDLEPVRHCAVAHPLVDDTGALAVDWPDGSELEISVGVKEAVVELTSAGRSRVNGAPSGEVVAGLWVDGKMVRPPKSVGVTVLGHRFSVSPGVFWQAHVGAAEALGQSVLEVLEPQPAESVTDLYAGAGLFAVLLAHAVGPKGDVVAVERNRRACSDARRNAKGLPQVRVLQASVSPRLLGHQIGRPTLLVLDPAREGAGTAVMRALRSHRASLRRLAYVSCDVGSFSRDAKVLLDDGWTMTSLRALDIFPMSEHVELVAGFEPG